MYTHIQLYGLIILSLIVVFSLIHLGVSIGIIDGNRPYENIFRPEIGLSSYNIVIAFLGITVGSVGLMHMLTEYKGLGKIAGIMSGVLGIFALISLITALIINSKSSSYVNTRLNNNMNQYMNDPNAADLVDLIQVNYACCGQISWADWATFQPESTTVSTTMSTTATLVVGTSTTSPISTTTMLEVNQTTMLANNTVLTSSTGATHTSSTGTTAALQGKSLDIQKRQTSNDMINVPVSTQVLVPPSCCMNIESSINNFSLPTCSPDQLYTSGCLKFLLQRANNQDMGIGIINCFLILLAFAALPFLLPTSIMDESHTSLYTQQLDNMRSFGSTQRNYPTGFDNLG